MNGTMMQYFHWYYPNDGSLWKKLVNDLPLLQKLGINAVWLPPAYKDSSQGQNCGYDAYDLFDLGEFEQKGQVRTKYGTKDEYLTAITAAHQAGLSVYGDIVLNHKAGADETEKVRVVKVNPSNRNEIISEPYEAELYTRFLFPGRSDHYSSFKWNYQCFTGVDFSANPQETGVFKILNEYGNNWEEVLSEENGNFDYLMFNDIEYRNPVVREELKYWGRWYLEMTKIDGVRLDAVKHMAPEFFTEWLQYMQNLSGKELFAVGEVWSTHDLGILKQFVDRTQGKISLFDSILHHHFFEASNKGKDYDLRTILDNTFVYEYPHLAVTISDNHDTQPLQALEAPVSAWFKPISYAIMLLRKDGYPSVFYPDLFGARYVDKGRDGKDYEINLEPCNKIEPLLMARNAFAYGEQKDYFDHPNCIGWTRSGREDEVKGSGCAVLVSNGDDGFKDMEIGNSFSGRTFYDFLGNSDKEVKIDENGWGRFLVPAGSVSVWVSR